MRTRRETFSSSSDKTRRRLFDSFRVIVLTLCVGVFIWLANCCHCSMGKKVKNVFRPNGNPIYFYEHILNPFSLCNHCFYVFSFYFFLSCFHFARIPFHSIQSTADHSIPNRFSSLSGQKSVDLYANSHFALAIVRVGLCIVLADENTFRFTAFNPISEWETNGKERKLLFSPSFRARQKYRQP